MNGYVYYFTVVIFVMINYHLCSGDIISEKNYRSIQRRRLVRKLHNRNKKKFKAGWQHSLEQAHIISDLNSVDIISVNEIGGDEICEVSQVNIDRIYREQTISDAVYELRGGCCCNPEELNKVCEGTGDDDNAYYGSTTWRKPAGTYTIDGKTRGISCESAKINYNTNNYYEIEIYIRGNEKGEYDTGTNKDTKSAVVGADSGTQINYLIITKTLKEYVTIAGPTSSYEIKDYESDDPNNPNTSPYAGCCNTASTGGHKEEIKLKLENTGDITTNYYELSDVLDKLNIKTGDRIFLKSGYGIATDDEWHDDNGNAMPAAQAESYGPGNSENYNTPAVWGGTPVRSSIGIPFSIGYYTNEDVDGTPTQVWNPLKAQDWNGNFVSLAEVGCRSWWNFVTISPGDGNFDKRVKLNKQYEEICQPNEKQWMAMPSELDNLRIRIKIPTGSELMAFHRTIFGYSGADGTVQITATDGFRGEVTTDNDWHTNFLVRRNLFLLHNLGIVQLNSAVNTPYLKDGLTATGLVETGPELATSVYDGTFNSKFPTQTYIDFVSVEIEEDEYKPFDVFLDYPSVGGISVRNYFLIDVEMLGWRDSNDQPVSCIGDPASSAAGCIASDKTLKVISSEMIETACSPDFYKDYSNNRGRCKKCITSCTYGQYVDTTVCTGYGRDTQDVCKDVVRTRFCPSLPGGAPQDFNTAKQVPDCNGVCGGEETNCPWMYGYAQLRNPWQTSNAILVQPADANDAPITSCGYYCGKWRGISRMDNGFPEFVFVPIHPDEPICKLLKGHDLVSQCKIVIESGATAVRDFTCTGTGNSDGSTELDFTGMMFGGNAVQGVGTPSYSQVNALINNLPKSESCGGTAVMDGLGYDLRRTTDGKSRTFKRDVNGDVVSPTN